MANRKSSTSKVQIVPAQEVKPVEELTTEDAATLAGKLDTMYTNAENAMNTAQETLDRMVEAQAVAPAILGTTATIDTAVESAASKVDDVLSELEAHKIKMAAVDRVGVAVLRGFWLALGAAALGTEVLVALDVLHTINNLGFYGAVSPLVLASILIILGTFKRGRALYSLIGKKIADVLARISWASPLITFCVFLLALAAIVLYVKFF